MAEKVDILAIGAHPDDVELSAAGTIAKHIALGKKVAIVDMTQGELGSRGSVSTRYEEADLAQKILGVVYRENTQLKDGFFEENEESLLKLITQIRHFQPEIVLANAPSDRHPDHGRAASFIVRACFLAGLLKIETQRNAQTQKPWRPKAIYHYIQDNYLEPDFVVDVSPYKDLKFEAILAYKTQFFNPSIEGPKTPISGKEFLNYLEARMIQFGRCINVNYAEGFIANRTIGIENFFDLK
jgi:bacillithiol biosynthesis deacetylase BshB1